MNTSSVAIRACTKMVKLRIASTPAISAARSRPVINWTIANTATTVAVPASVDMKRQPSGESPSKRMPSAINSLASGDARR